MNILKNINLKKSFIFLIISLLSIISCISFLNMEITLFPDYDKFNLESFCDKDDDGESKILDFSYSGNKILFKYILKKTPVTPFAGFGLYLNDPLGFDISGYKKLKIALKLNKPGTINLETLFFIENYTDPGGHGTYHYVSNEIEASDKMTEYTIPIEKHYFPDKEMDNNKTATDQKVSNVLNSLYGLEMTSLPGQAFDTINTINIDKIKLENTFFLNLFIISTGLLIISILFFIWSIFFNTRKESIGSEENIEKNIIKINNHVSFENNADLEAKKLFDFLSENYMDPEISLKKANHTTGISVHKIPQIINSFYNISFKQYINKVRIEEGKRLLEKSDLQISEVAIELGYNSITHFGRVFKQIEGSSPKEFRKSKGHGNK